MDENTIVNEIDFLIKAKKAMIPFAQNSISCNAVLKANDIAYLDLSNYQAIEEYCPSDKTITVQCGIKIKNLLDFLAKENQWLPLAYGSDQISLLDLILTGDNGPLEALFGGLRRHILGMTFVLSNGKVAKTGGKVVKNVSGYDLSRFIVGSYGYFAIPIKAHLRIYSLPEEFLSIKVESNDFEQLLTAVNEILSSSVSVTYADIFDQKLLEKESIPEKSDKRLILLLQLYGDRNNILAGVSNVKNILAHRRLEYLEITDLVEQNNLLQQLTNISKRVNKSTQVNESEGRLIDLILNEKELLPFSKEAELFSFPFVYRVTSQRLRICVNPSQQDTVLNLLTEYAQKRSAPITVSYSDNQYIRLVSQLGQTSDNDETMSGIKQGLKRAFDPANLFNPFVKL